MSKYVAQEFLVHKGELVAIGGTVELTEEQAKRLGAKVILQDEAAEDDMVDYDKPLEDMTVKELKAEAKELGITGYSGMDREQLIAAIEGEEDDTEE